MIYSTKSNHVVLAAAQIIDNSMVSACAYVGTPPGSLVDMYDIFTDEPVGMWKVPEHVTYPVGTLLPSFVLDRVHPE